MRKVAFLCVALATACGGSDRDTDEPWNGSGGSGGQVVQPVEPTVTTYIVECVREEGADWSLIAASISSSSGGRQECGGMMIAGPGSDGSAEDLGLAITLPSGAFVTQAIGGRDALCDQPRDTWPAAQSGSGSIVLTGDASDPTEIDFNVTLTFDPVLVIEPLVFGEKTSLTCQPPP